MNLVIDVGNTRTKYAFFENDQLVEVKYTSDELLYDIGKWKEKGKKINLLLSGSGKLQEGLRILLEELCDTFTAAFPAMKLPLKIGYATPETLGFDRVAICVGAIRLQPGRPVLVIDSGTAITFNYVNEKGVFLGGNISPGLEMRFRSLHQFTARLPYVSPLEEYGGIGRTTEEAIRNGVMDGMLFEVKNYIEHFMRENSDGKVLVTGGNSHYLEKCLGKNVEFCKVLGFIGLNEILRFTKKCN